MKNFLLFLKNTFLKRNSDFYYHREQTRFEQQEEARRAYLRSSSRSA